MEFSKSSEKIFAEKLTLNKKVKSYIFVYGTKQKKDKSGLTASRRKTRKIKAEIKSKNKNDRENEENQELDLWKGQHNGLTSSYTKLKRCLTKLKPEMKRSITNNVSEIKNDYEKVQQITA